MKKIFLAFIFFNLLFFVNSNRVFAALPDPELEFTVKENLKCQGGTGINTAIGCIPINNEEALLEFLLRWFIGIAGAIAISLIVYAGIQIMTSSGNPEKIGAGKELLTAAIGGIVLLIFSVFILRLFGVEILKLPGFN